MFKIHFAQNYLLSLIRGINFHCDYLVLVSLGFTAFLFIHGIPRLLKSLNVEGDNFFRFFNQFLVPNAKIN